MLLPSRFENTPHHEALQQRRNIASGNASAQQIWERTPPPSTATPSSVKKHIASGFSYRAGLRTHPTTKHPALSRNIPFGKLGAAGKNQSFRVPRGLEEQEEMRCRKRARRCGAKNISKSKCEKHHMLTPRLDVQMSFRGASARDCAPCQKRANVRVLWNFQKRWQAWDIWGGSAKMHFLWQEQYKRHVHQRC